MRRPTIVCAPVLVYLNAAVGHASTVIYVNSQAAPGGNGLSWNTAFDNLQDALNLAAGDGSTGAQIWVATGTYLPSLRTNPNDPRSATFRLGGEPISMYGGFAGGETSITQRNIAANKTTLSADLNLDDGPNFANRADNAYNVVTIACQHAMLLDGFTIRGGNAEGPEAFQSVGGAVTLVEESNGIPPIIARCMFTENEAFAGGAFYGFGFKVINCTFFNNRSDNLGGAVHVAGTAAHSRELINCVFMNNQAEFGGAVGGMYGGYDVINCTVVGNYASWNAGGLGIQGPGAFFKLNNSIVWGNSAGSPLSLEANQLWVPPTSIVLSPLSNNCIQDWAGTYLSEFIVSDDPTFVDALGPDGIAWTGDEDLRLREGSGCIDAGANSLVALDAADLDADSLLDEPHPLDLLNASRIQGKSVDIGAFEHPVCPADVDGNGQVNVSDLLVVINNWGNCPVGDPCAGDIAPSSGDGSVNVSDLLAVIAQWGSCN